MTRSLQWAEQARQQEDSDMELARKLQVGITNDDDEVSQLLLQA